MQLNALLNLRHLIAYIRSVYLLGAQVNHRIDSDSLKQSVDTATCVCALNYTFAVTFAHSIRPCQYDGYVLGTEFEASLQLKIPCQTFQTH